MVLYDVCIYITLGVLFYTPVACTEWRKFLVRLNGNKDYNLDPHIGVPDPNQLMEPMRVRNMTTTEASRIMNDPEWRRIIFLRDPATRLLSAYLDKFVNHPAKKVTIYGGMNRNMTFEEMVGYLAKHSSPGELRQQNEHWRPQVDVCVLNKFMPLYDFVGSYESLSNHSRLVLQELGLWEEYGANGWGW